MQDNFVVGMKLKQLREHYRASPELVSSKTGISVDNLLRYEEGIAMPNMQEITILARLYRVGIEFFIPQQAAYQPVQQQTMYQPTQAQYSRPIPQTIVNKDYKNTVAYKNRAKRLKALKRSALIRLFTFISVLVFGGIGYCIYTFEFGSFAVSEAGAEVIKPLTGLGLLNQFLHPQLYVRLLSANLYLFLGIGGLLTLIQLVRIVSKNVVLKFLAKCLSVLFVCIFLMAVFCFIQLYASHSLGFILYLVGLFVCIFPLFFSLMKEIKVD